MSQRILLPEEIVESVKAYALTQYPNEACGLILAEKASGTLKLFAPVRNIQDLLHQKDPHRYGRTARTGYEMDPREVQSLEERYQNTHTIAGIFHSHADAGVYFSEEDLNMAVPLGEPLFPDRFYFIVSVDTSGVKAASIFTWNGRRGQFVEDPLDMDEG